MKKRSASARKKLVSRKMVQMITPPEGSGFEAMIGAFRDNSDPRKLAQVAREAGKWVQEAIDAVRNAREPNPWRKSTDEEIAEEILRRVEEREKRHGRQT